MYSHEDGGGEGGGVLLAAIGMVWCHQLTLRWLEVTAHVRLDNPLRCRCLAGFHGYTEVWLARGVPGLDAAPAAAAILGGACGTGQSGGGARGAYVATIVAVVVFVAHVAVGVGAAAAAVGVGNHVGHKMIHGDSNCLKPDSNRV